VLIANHSIEITIDIDNNRLQEEDHHSTSIDDLDFDGILSPKNAVAPNQRFISVQPNPHQSVSENDITGDITPEIGTPRPNDKTVQLEWKKAPSFCRFKICLPCRKLCYPDPSKPKKSCSEIFCKSFSKAKKKTMKFKMSWSLLT
jgi:hypothetical protein